MVDHLGSLKVLPMISRFQRRMWTIVAVMLRFEVRRLEALVVEKKGSPIVSSVDGSSSFAALRMALWL